MPVETLSYAFNATAGDPINPVIKETEPNIILFCSTSVNDFQNSLKLSKSLGAVNISPIFSSALSSNVDFNTPRAPFSVVIVVPIRPSIRSRTFAPSLPGTIFDMNMRSDIFSAHICQYESNKAPPNVSPFETPIATF